MTTETESIPSLTSRRFKDPQRAPQAPRGTRIAQRAKLLVVLYGLMSFTIIGVLTFIFYPQLGAIKYSFYDWDGGQLVEKFRGWGNYVEAFTQDKLFWPTFQLVLILLAANAIKMWPSIFTAVILHRLKSAKLQYFFRVMFVVPLIIPGIVTLLVWKSFFDPQLGPLNKLLVSTGLINVLRKLDVVMPKIAAGLSPIMGGDITWLWIVLAAGVVMIFVRAATARRIGLLIVIGSILLLLLGRVWTEPTRAFESNTPAWLSHSKLIVPSLILWGFPWVGTIGVLIYLAGLQNITADVYEAAELDGVGSFGKFWYIEFPLVMTQIRINLIFMTIGTLTDYGLVLLLLGAGGGPGGVGMTPGLYMYSTAFVEGRFGYACALGMVLAVIILIITVLYQRYVKVDK